MALRVLIAGAGLGGLCLAQGLRQAGVEVEVFERDAAGSARAQGYRFRIDRDGDAGLRACLPPHLYALYQATSSRPAAPPAGAWDHHMRELYRIDSQQLSPHAPPHAAVNRQTLREILMGGLHPVIRFGSELIRVEAGASQVRAHFADGTTAAGDVLAAADGTRSVVRRQLLPQAEPFDTGMRCIFGKAPLDARLSGEFPEVFRSGFVPFVGPERRTLAMGAFRSRQSPPKAAAQLAPEVHLTPVDDYLMWLAVAPSEAFLKEMTPHQSVLALLEGWHPTLRSVVERTDAVTLGQVAIRTAPPMMPWPASRIAFLGDAIHTMTPAGGIGANTALRDAARLTAELAAAQRGDVPVVEAIARYEAGMRDYGGAAVRRSLAGAAHLYRVVPPVMEPV